MSSGLLNEAASMSKTDTSLVPAKEPQLQYPQLTLDCMSQHTLNLDKCNLDKLQRLYTK